MITHISGKLNSKKNASVVVEVGGISYEILMPPVLVKSIERALQSDGSISLVTFHYHQMEPSRAIPVLIGFINEIEKEFFEHFIKVSGVGPKAACRALTLSFATIADAIDRGDVPLLKTLPGIGEQKAREIVAKLQGKVAKFGLIRDGAASPFVSPSDDIKEEAVSVLLQLQYKKAEAKDMVDRAMGRNPKLSSCEEILNEVYRGSRPEVLKCAEDA